MALVFEDLKGVISRGKVNNDLPPFTPIGGNLQNGWAGETTMGKQQTFIKARKTVTHVGFNADTRKGFGLDAVLLCKS